ncbi:MULTISPECIES: DUF5388 domain-containing protein [Enterococcus]|uniref:Uncharacterized protein n=1 Tax=Enterococcus faecium TaxID=1352 RepID=A0AB73N0U2_ENTFC|nr:DUF5388 domain-containing protein [Enterococcus faecium]EGP4808306.1 DUF5388 domain-containing protein [Enterococcus faecium]EGP4986454.1 DUF5388 domain-containing protein [Enterococcus faecium]EGP5140848.1 hypothetical protein [Enterococcus faecium]EME7167150.1 hypothetical protein [Enterococcus faecium]EME8119756.1 hypothetical protein [Enterococcus faecium]
MGMLDRGAKIEITPSIKKEDIINETKTEFASTDNLPANIRVNNKLRNRVNALSVIGYGDSQKEIVAQLLDSFISNLSEDEQKRISDLEDIYRSKDQKNLLKKKNR